MAIGTGYIDRPGLKLCYAAARRIVAKTLQADDSLFTSGSPIWSPANISDLYDRFVGRPDVSADSFEAKFRRQLEGAPPATIQLASELLFVHLLVPNDISGQTKRALIQEVLSWSPAPILIPDQLAETLDDGFLRAGIAFKTYRPMQLWFLLEFYRAWKQLENDERARLLDDPWAFKTFVWDIPLSKAYSQREALLHIVHPETFEDISSRDHKRKIANGFREHVHSPTDDVDRDLLQIRQSLEKETGHPVNFYQPPLVNIWQPPTSPAAPKRQQGTASLRAWFVRGSNVDGRNLVPDWLREGFCSIRWEELGEIPAGTPRSELTRQVEESYPDDTRGARQAHVGNLDRFINQMSPGDLIVTTDGGKVFVGTVASGPIYLGPVGGSAPRRREVHWENPNEPISRDELSAAAFAKLRTLLTVSEITDDASEYALLTGMTPGADEPEAVVPSERVHLLQPDEALSSRLLMPRAWLTEVVELLDEKRQVVFYGPPGTGKTYLAQRLAT